MKKKSYASPEADVELFFIDCCVMTLSGIEEDSGTLEGNGSDYEGGDDWDF